MNIDHVLVRDFALLHQGGATADAGDSFRPRKDGAGNQQVSKVTLSNSQSKNISTMIRRLAFTP